MALPYPLNQRKCISLKLCRVVDLGGYWTTQYNWRKRGPVLNRFNHFIADVSRTNIHNH